MGGGGTYVSFAPFGVGGVIHGCLRRLTLAVSVLIQSTDAGAAHHPRLLVGDHVAVVSGESSLWITTPHLGYVKSFVLKLMTS